MPSLARRSPSVRRAREALRGPAPGLVALAGEMEACACGVAPLRVRWGRRWLARCVLRSRRRSKPSFVCPFLRGAGYPEVVDVVRQTGQSPHRARREVAKPCQLRAGEPPSLWGACKAVQMTERDGVYSWSGTL